MINRRKSYVFIFLLAIPTSVLANTLPWQGPYVGLYLGGNFANNTVSTNTGSVTNTSYFVTDADVNSVNNAFSWQKEPSTGIVGLQAGHNWNWKQVVYGIVLDYGSMSLHSSNDTNNTYPDNSNRYSVSSSISTNWLFTLRGRLGYQKQLYFPGFLYLTGGMAITQLKVNNYFNDNSSLEGNGFNGISQNQIGWTIGAGAEVAAFKHMSVNIEYLYINIPSLTTAGSIFNTQSGFGIPVHSMTSSFSSTANFYTNAVRIGLNYRFDE